MEYDSVGALTKLTIFRYFWEDLKPSILAEPECWKLELKNFNQIIKKAVKVKAKSTLQSHFSIKKMDQNYLQNNQPASSIVVMS